VDHPAERRRDHHVALGGEELLLRDPLGLRELVDVPDVLDVELEERVRVDPGVAADRAVDGVDGDQLAALVVQDAGGPRADVAEALDGERQALELQPEVLGGLLQDEDDAAAVTDVI
jgi:hypothetical protein